MLGEFRADEGVVYQAFCTSHNASAHPEYRTAAQEYDDSVLILGVADSLVFVLLL